MLPGARSSQSQVASPPIPNAGLHNFANELPLCVPTARKIGCSCVRGPEKRRVWRTERSGRAGHGCGCAGPARWIVVLYVCQWNRRPPVGVVAVNVVLAKTTGSIDHACKQRLSQRRRRKLFGKKRDTCKAYPVRLSSHCCIHLRYGWGCVGGGGWGAHEGGVSPNGDVACLPVSSSACFLSRWSRGLGCALNQESGRAGKHPVLEGFWYAPSVVSNHEMGDVG